MRDKLKRKFFILIGMSGVVAVLSGLATSWFYSMRMDRITKGYTLEMEQHGLLLKDHGNDLKSLGSAISSYAEIQNRHSPGSLEQQKLQQYAEEIQQHGEELSKYGEQLISSLEIKHPHGALLDMSDVQAIVPENLQKIKQERQKVDALQALILKYRARMQSMEYELDACRMDESAALRKVRESTP